MSKSILSKLSIVSLSALALSGCVVTNSLWDSSDYKLPKTVSTEETIYSFGFTKPDSQNLPANRLVMLGEKTAYITDVTPQHDLVKALRTTELSKPFDIVNMYGDSEKLKVSMSRDNQFSTHSDINNGKGYVCLGYRFQPADRSALKKREVAILTKLGFKLSGSPLEIQEERAPYMRCYDTIKGQAYAMSTPLPAEYRFKTPLPVIIESLQGEVEVDNASVAGKVALTPLAIMGDIIMLPVMLPLAPFMWPRGSKI